MIVRMTKYSFVVLTRELDTFLDRLQELGMMDITRSARPIDRNSREMVELSARYKSTASLLNRLAKSLEGVEPVRTEVEESALLESIEKVLSAKDEAAALRSQLLRDIQESEVWGEFSHSDLERLHAIGLQPHFYVVSAKRYQKSWEEEYPLQILNSTSGKVYFTIVSPVGEEFSFPIQEATFPAQPASVLRERLKRAEEDLEMQKRLLAGYLGESEHLMSLRERLHEKLDLYLAGVSSVKEGEDTISVLEGFAPTSEDAAISAFLDGTSALYITEAATQKDNPPVTLKNNWFARAFEPIGSLYVLPKYDELDLTPFYAPFYMLFFGLCLGDLGYGLVMVLIGLIAIWKLPKFSANGKLILWLGIGTLIMPLLSGTFFGMKLAEIIPTLPQDIKSFFFSDLEMFWFAIIFGIFHLIFAKMVRGIDCLRRKMWDGALTNFGWSLVITWCAFAYAGMEMETNLLPPMLSNIIGIVGLVLVLFCSKPTKFFLLRPFKGIISLYDITGVFGDVLSYIRLFGLGATGGILAMVINSIALQLSGIPYVGWVLTVILLIIGHIAVMGLSALGAFVHPVRLTFVEFYKNAEFEGGGREYKPLKRE